MIKNILKAIEYETISKRVFIEKGFDEKDFDKLLRYIKEYNNYKDRDVLKFVKIGYKKQDKDTITFTNYIGVIQFGNDKRIEILPKIAYRNEEAGINYDKTKKILVKMFKCLKDDRGNVFDFAGLNTSNLDIYEIFIKVYINEVIRLIKSGIKSSYINKNDNLYVFKGKLLVKENILYNHSNKERIFVSYDEFTQDCPENRIIKSTLKKLYSISNDINNQFKIGQLLQQLDFIKESNNYEADFQRIVLDRSKQKYRRIIQWSQVFLLNKSYSIFSGDSKFQSLLFPMDRLFEDYIAHNIKKSFVKYGWRVKTQVDEKYLFVEPKKFKLKPDILLLKNDQAVILDTKWKVLNNDRNNNYGISQADMYQMYAYCKKYNDTNNNIKDVWLLYPYVKNVEQLPTYKSDDNVNVHIFFVDLENIENSMAELVSIINNSS